MFNLKLYFLKKIASSLLILLVTIGCSKNQNSFLPNRKVNFSTTAYEYNFLTISGNSVLFTDQGVNGVIVVCVDPASNQYYAYDATCPYEKDFSGVVVIHAVKNYVSPFFRIFSSDFYGICKICGSKFNLMGGGQPVKGPATHYLQSYNVIHTDYQITVIN